MHKCPSQERISAYLLDELTPDECAQVDAHVANCEACECLMSKLCEELALGTVPSGKNELASNLLFGLLALHNSFITRETLVAATGVWLEDKSRQLQAILVERNHLTADDCQLLTALVDKHLSKHLGDPDRTLAELSSLPNIKHDLEQFGDPDLNASLHFARITSESAGLPNDALAVAEGKRFKELYSHAKGGLGEIFVAHDQQLDRNVALKRMQTRHAQSALSRIRFELEAEVTGKLEHPGIVPVYSRGADDGGRPFYAMRFIRGKTLKEEIDTFHKAFPTSWRSGNARLELQRLVRRLIDICNAIEYAHHRGVLHRDLKPANVMLGRFGETMVVDWGLAKTAEPLQGEESSDEEPAVHLSGGSASGPTTMGTVVGTLGYMSPEQASGNPEEVGPLSDVYSLGAILYRLLTGKSSQGSDKDKMAILARIEKGEFPRPRELNPLIPPPLESICLRAMALRSSDRYESARALADDLENWSADEKVLAHGETVVETIYRLVRRHRELVASAIAAVIVLSLLAVTFLAVRDAQRTERQAANYHRKVRDTVDVWLIGAAEDLKDIPAARGLREQLLRRAVEEFASLEQSDGGRALSLAEERALSAIRQGDLHQELGNADSAIKRYEVALKAFQGQPDSLENSLHQAECWAKRAGVATDQGTNPDEFHQAALDIYRRLVEEHPENEYALDAKASCLTQMGTHRVSQNDLRQAESLLGDAVDTARLALMAHRQLPHQEQHDLSYFQEGLCHALRALGDTQLRQSNELAKAEKNLDEARSLSHELKNDDPSNRHRIELLADTVSFAANVLRKQERFDAELANREQVVADYEILLTKYPWVQRYQESWARAHINLAQTHLLRKESEAAHISASLANQRLLELTETPQALPRFKNQLATTHQILAEVLLVQKQHSDALTHAQTAERIFGAVQTNDTVDLQHRRAINFRVTGQIFATLNRNEEAHTALTQSVQVLTQLNSHDRFGQFMDDLERARSALAGLQE